MTVNTKNYLKFALSFAAVVVWMVVIFLFSGQNGQTSAGMSGGIIEAVAKFFNPDFENLSLTAQGGIIASWQFFVRKCAHFLEYMVLGVLTANAFNTLKLNMKIKVFAPLAVTILYAISDEVHQYFVPDRACRLFDICVDSVGGVVGITVFFLGALLIKKSKIRKGVKNDSTHNN